jgi:hypothetical protein
VAEVNPKVRLLMAWAMTAALLMAGGSRAAGPIENSPAKGGQAGPPKAMLNAANIKLEFHGALKLDYVGFDRGERTIDKVTGSMENNFSARQARFRLRGKLFDNIGFFLQMAFDAPTAPYLIDAMLTIPVAPWLDFEAGLMKIPFSEERLRLYANRQHFMDRSLAANLTLSRSQGAQLRLHLPDSDAINLYVGAFTGENLVTANTDDHFEYAGRLALRFDQIFDGLPGYAQWSGSYAWGKRLPERTDPISSFQGKTFNGLVFFAPVPVNGARTRYETDFEWRLGPVNVGGEYIKSMEERNNVIVNLRTNGGTAKVKRDLAPLAEAGWNVFFVWVITGEEAKPLIEPAREWGAWSMAVRYSMITFESGDHRIKTNTPGVHGHEINDTAKALGRSGIGDTMRDLYIGINWDIHPGVFFQAAAIWQWWDYSSPFYQDQNKHYDINYAARVGMIF